MDVSKLKWVLEAGRFYISWKRASYAGVAGLALVRCMYPGQLEPAYLQNDV